MNQLRLYRLPEKGVLTGVCAGLAGHFGWNLLGVRIMMVIASCVLMPVVPILYVIAAVLLPRAPMGAATGLAQNSGPYDVNRAHVGSPFASSTSPVSAYSSMSAPVMPGVYGDAGHRVRELEARLRELEAYMTSSRYEFDRALKRGPLQGN